MKKSMLSSILILQFVVASNAQALCIGTDSCNDTIIDGSSSDNSDAVHTRWLLGAVLLGASGYYIYRSASSNETISGKTLRLTVLPLVQPGNDYANTYSINFLLSF